ncbi:MAG: TolC family protein [Verrucomicrobiota bacterium]
MTYTRGGAIIALAATVFSGCTNTRLPDQSQNADAPDQSTWINAPSSNASVDGAWIQSFDDATLNDLVAEALEKNFQLNSADARASAAKADAAIASSSRFPFINLSLSSGRQKSRFINLDIPGLGATTTESHNFSLGAQWEIDLWGKLALNAASARAQADISEQEFEALKISLSAQVTRAWFDAIEANQQLTLALDTVDAFDSQLSALEKRYQRGLISGFDLRLTRAQAAAARAAAQNRRIQKGDSLRILETLLGRYPQAKLETASQLPSINAPIQAGLPAGLLSRRPDLRAEERRLAASFAQQKVAARNWLPNISLTGSSGTTSDQFSDLLDSDFDIWSVLGTAAAPLFQSGKLKAERQRADSLLEAQVAQYKDAVLTAFREVESALSAEPDLKALEDEIRISATENKKAEDQAWELYEKGLIDITAVLDSERRSFDSQSQLINVVNQRLQNRISLHLALGGSATE